MEQVVLIIVLKLKKKQPKIVIIRFYLIECFFIINK